MKIRDLTQWGPARLAAHGQTGRKAVDQLHYRMDRLWDDFLSSSDINPERHGFQNGQFAGPQVDVFENDKEYRFEVELPGLAERQVQIFACNNTLTIKGEKTPQSQAPVDRPLRLERSYGAFERSFALPIDACEDKVSATFDGGVLTVRIVKNLSARLDVNQIQFKSAA